MKILILLVAHLISVLLYTSFPDSTKISQVILYDEITYQNAFSIWYFGTEAFFACAFLILATNKNNSIVEKQFIFVEAFLWVLRGCIYIIDDIHIYNPSIREKLILIWGTILIATVIIGFSIKKHGFLIK